MGTKRDKWLITVLCALGVLGVVYGMAKKNDPAFIAGLLFVILGYLRIRKEIKSTWHNGS